MKFQDLFSLKNNKNNKKLSSAAVVIGALRVNLYHSQMKFFLFFPENRL